MSFQSKYTTEEMLNALSNIDTANNIPNNSGASPNGSNPKAKGNKQYFDSVLPTNMFGTKVTAKQKEQADYFNNGKVSLVERNGAIVAQTGDNKATTINEQSRQRAYEAYKKRDKFTARQGKIPTSATDPLEIARQRFNTATQIRNDAQKALGKAQSEMAYADPNSTTVTDDMVKASEALIAAQKEYESAKQAYIANGGKISGLGESIGLDLTSGAKSAAGGVLSTVGEAMRRVAINGELLRQTGSGTSAPTTGVGLKLRNKGAELQQSAAQDLATANTGKGALAQFGNTVVSQGVPLVGDIAMNFIVPGSGLAAMGVRAFGNSMNEALANGATEDEAVLYGLASTAVEVATEKLGGIMPGYGDGLLDGITDSLVKKAKSEGGERVLKLAMSMLEEGTEEAIATLVNPALQSIYNDKDVLQNYSEKGLSQLISDALYDAAVGAALGGIGTASAQVADIVDTNRQWQSNLDDMSEAFGMTETTPAQTSHQTVLQEETRKYAAQQNTAFVENALRSGRVNNTTANIILNNPSMRQLFTDITGFALDGTKEQNRATIQRVARTESYNEQQNQAIAQQAATQAAEEQAVRESGYGSFIRGVLLNGTDNLTARNIVNNAQMRATWEQMSGKTLPVNQKSAIKMIMQTRRKTTNIPDQDVAVKTANAVNATQDTAQLPTQTMENAPQDNPPAGAVSDVGIEQNATQGQIKPFTQDVPRAAETAQSVQTQRSGTADTINGSGRAVESGMSANIRTDSARPAAERQSFTDNPDIYRQLTNAETLAKAQAIYDEGFEQASAKLSEEIGRAKGGMKLSPEYVPLAKMVADEYFRQGNSARGREILSDVGAELTAAGRLGQANIILRGSDVSTKVMAIQKMIDKLNADLTQRQKNVNIKNGVGSKTGSIVVADALLNKYAEATSDKAGDAALTQIEQSIADQIPATFADKFTAMRYLNMLGNLKTQGRNLIGNIAMGVGAVVKRRVQAVIELSAALATGGKYERSTSLSTKGFKAAWNDFNTVSDEAMGEAKLANDVSQLPKGVRDKQTIFKFKPLEAYRKATTWAMEMGDQIFIRFHYADTLSGWLNAHGVSIETASQEQLEKGREFAIKEAQEATFRDTNAVSEWVSTFDKGWGKNKFGKAMQTVTQGIVPFRKTPANVAVRAVEYSPVGLAETVIKGIQAANGKATAADVINSLAKNATGAALFAAGLLMQSAGMARGNGGDDEDLNNFQKLQGAMDWSINIDGNNVSLAQFAPLAVPFFMGVQFGEMGAIKSTDDLAKIIGCVSDPMLEMSMLSGINDAFEQIASFDGDSEAFPKFMTNAVLSYLTQGFTNTLLGQFAQAQKENRQTVYSTKDGVIGSNLQYRLAKAGQKFPSVDYNQQDYVDAWGRTQSNGTTGERYVNAFLNPTYYTKQNTTATDRELERLYTENKDKDDFPNVLPKKRSRSSKYGNGKVMTPDEYLQFSKDSGQMKYKLVTDFIESSEYKNMTDEQRAKVISDLYSFANDRALKKIKASNGVKSKSKWDAVASLSNITDYLAAKQIESDRDDGFSTSGIDSLFTIVQHKMSDADADRLAEKYLEKSEKQKAAYDMMREDGKTPAQAIEEYLAINENRADDSSSYSQAEVAHYLYSNGITGEEAERRWNLLLTNETKTKYSDWIENKKNKETIAGWNANK